MSVSQRSAPELDAACEALTIFADRQRGPSQKIATDAGPALLAALVAASGQPAGIHAAERGVVAWLDGRRAGASSASLFGDGMAGLYAGAQAIAPFHPRLAPLAARLRGRLVDWSTSGQLRTEAVAWHDYDLITGPAGVLLALATDPACPAECVLPIARHLASLADAGDLRRLRVGAYQDDELRGWNFGRVNAGLGHGIPGVAAALRAACDIAGAREDLTVPLGRVARWLVANSYVDARSVRAWPGGGLDGQPPPAGASHRQAWCYGTPGVAWTLWDAGRVSGDTALQAFAADALRTLCAAWDDDYYIDDGPVSDALGVCHGAAGTLAITDAFARHAGLADAARLRDHLEAYLLDRLDAVGRLATDDMSLLTGASGVLAVLLTLGGGQRDWLTQIALR